MADSVNGRIPWPSIKSMRKCFYLPNSERPRFEKFLDRRQALLECWEYQVGKKRARKYWESIMKDPVLKETYLTNTQQCLSKVVRSEKKRHGRIFVRVTPEGSSCKYGFTKKKELHQNNVYRVEKRKDDMLRITRDLKLNTQALLAK
jgi:hypothetical protein